MKRFFTFTLSLLIPALLFSQSKMLLSPGVQKGKASEVLRVKQSIMNYGSMQKVASYDVVEGVAGTIDTSGHLPMGSPDWDTNFGMFGQDVMMQWFVAPADMDIVSVGFRTSDDAGPNVSVKLVEINWTVEQLASAGVTHQGWYEATGNGFNDIEPLIENDHEFTVGDWVAQPGNGDLGSPVGLDIWSDGGFGAPVTVDRAETEWSWVSMSLLGFNPSVTEGTVYGVVIKNDNTTIDDPDSRHGLFASTSGTGVSGFKFYNGGRFSTFPDPDPASWGWWSREYNWAIFVEVLLTGDRAPLIQDVSNLPTTLSTDPRTVSATITDDNPSGGPAGVGVANLLYTIDGGDAVTVAMTNDGDTYSADIPGQPQGTDVVYWVEATDVEARSSQSAIFGYSIFEVTSNTLLTFNGYTAPSGYPQSYYFGLDNSGPLVAADFSHDAWSYGELTEELVSNYDNIIEIATTGISDDNQEVLAAWIAADAGHNYALAGDEYLGSYSGWPGEPVPYEPGTFFNDILGITVEYSDIVGGSADVTPIRPVMGSALGDAMYQKAMTLGISIDSIWYDPNFEIGVVNWLDGVEITEDSETFMETDSAGGYPTAPAVQSIGHNRVLAEGNKIAFFGYDPLSVNSSPYFWFGFDESSPMIQVLDWFNIVVSVEDEVGTVAKSFNLKQNYPNPFNPTTTIEYTIPAKEKVEVKVFNVIGKEVATLVNGKVAAGTHTVEFDASNLASGLYIYQIKAGNNISSKKMLLVK